MASYPTRPGSRYPPGATPDENGTNFSIFSRNASAVELCLYESAHSPTPFQLVKLDPEVNRTFFSWHVFVEGLRPGTHYTWRVDGPNDTAQTGFRFNPETELLDPWAKAVTDALWDRAAATNGNASTGMSMRTMVVEEDYDWEGDRHRNHPLAQAVIYELHVGGFTRHPSSGAKHPGTFSALIEKIPYLKELGVNYVELMPVMAFDVQDVPPGPAELGLTNYWGYSSHSFYSPHPGYCVSPELGTHHKEFRDMVKALHKAGIGVILDVVFNHTAEGGAGGPTINFKGMANEIVYHLDPEDRSRYRDYTGCGNTINSNHPLVARFIVECLEYWVREAHVDGFRFDLASALARGEDGEPMYHAPVLWNIEFSDVLAYTRIIAEAWDAGGLYQVGGFPGFRWAEWNGRYRDVMRRFVRGDKGLVAEVATRVAGSSDLYQSAGRLPINSINFITCHDGFTLYDLVSYNHKHNDANGENNRDGHDDNLAWNCGIEGQTDDPDTLALRRRQAKNFMAILLLSQGVPMLLAGDEMLRTQRGNNNAYCQDNELGWIDWRLVETSADMLRFVREMIGLRKRHPSLMRKRFLTGEERNGNTLADITWHGVALGTPPWKDPDAQLLAFTLAAVEPDEEDLHVILNMSPDRLEMPLPHLSGKKWHRAIDTSETSPAEILTPAKQVRLEQDYFTIQPRSVVVLESRPDAAG